MLDWFRRLWTASIGKKFWMAATGLLLIAFLLVHLAENLLLYVDSSGAAFDAYVHWLEANPLLPAAEIGLLLLFVAHIAMALRVTAENRDARSHGYRVRASKGARTLASSSMAVTGVLLIVFLVVHVIDFRIGKELAANEGRGLYSIVRERLASPLGVSIYLAGMVVLALHLRHGFRSAMQSLGWSHPNLNPFWVRLGWLLSVVIAVGFASFPIYFWLRGDAP